MFCYDENRPGLHKRFLRAQILKYLSLQDYKAIDFPNGHCFGYALNHSILAVIGELSSWQQKKKVISDWDGEAASLTAPVTIAGRTRSVSQVFEEMITVLRLHQAPRTFNRGASQVDLFTKPGLLQVSVGEDSPPLQVTDPDKQYVVAAGHMSPVQMAQLLDKQFIDGNVVVVTGYAMGNKPHACTVRYAKGEDCYYFYCANELEGEVRCHDMADCVARVQERLTADVSIHLLDLLGTNAAKVQAFKSRYAALVAESGAALLGGTHGAREVALYGRQGAFVSLLKAITDSRQLSVVLNRLGDINGMSAVSLAMLAGPDSVAVFQHVSRLPAFDINAAVHANGSTLLLQAIATGHTDLVGEILKNPKLQVSGNMNAEAMIAAATHDRVSILQLLLQDKRFDANQPINGVRPLETAFRHKAQRVAFVLLKTGVSPTAAERKLVTQIYTSTRCFSFLFQHKKPAQHIADDVKRKPVAEADGAIVKKR